MLLSCLPEPQRPSMCCTGDASRTILVVFKGNKRIYAWHNHLSTHAGSDLQGNTGCLEAPSNLCGSSVKPEVRMHLLSILKFLERNDAHGVTI